MLRALCDRSATGRRFRLPALLAMAGSCLLVAPPHSCLEAAMNGPDRGEVRSAPPPSQETSPLRFVLLRAIHLYRTYISPIDGPRCGFTPSCSAFARQAVGEYGALRGVIMTADRLTRCNIFKEPGPDYHLLPNGKLFDPVSAHTLTEQ